MGQRRATTAAWELTPPPGGQQPSVQVLLWLEQGDDTRKPDQVAASCLMGLWNAGWTWDQAEQAVWDCPGLRADSRKPSRGRGWLRRVRTWCEATASDAPARDRAHAARLDLAAARTRTAARQWPRRKGHQVSAASVTKVLQAVLELADQAGRTKALHLSVREVSEAAGTSVGTTCKALRYLQVGQVGERVLYRLDAAQVARGKRLAATYELDLDAISDDAGDVEHAGVQADTTALLSHDAWRWGGLGASASRVWVVLSDRDALTPAEVAAAAGGLGVNWTRRLLHRLALHGLAVRSGNRWRRCSVAVAQSRLDTAARHLGTAGKGERQALLHAAQRDADTQARKRWLQRQRALQGALQDPATGLWVDAATGELVDAPGAPQGAPVHAPVAPQGVPAAEQVQRPRVTHVTVDGVRAAVSGDRVTADYTDPALQGRRVELTLALPDAWTEGLARVQAELDGTLQPLRVFAVQAAQAVASVNAVLLTPEWQAELARCRDDAEQGD